MLSKTLSYPFSATPAAFCLRLLLLIPFFTVVTLTTPFKNAVEEPLIRFSAWLSHVILSFLGAETNLSGRFISSTSTGNTIEVVSGCTGLFVFVLLLSAVLAFPARWSHRIKGLLLGAALLLCLNQARIVSLFLVHGHFPHLFDDLHLFVWQGIIIVVVTFYWYAWATRSPTGTDAAEA